MKYIMYEKDGQKFPIIFPDNFVHSDIDMALKSLGMYKNLIAINAGTIKLLEVEVSDESITLNLIYNNTDKQTIEMYDYLFGL